MSGSSLVFAETKLINPILSSGKYSSPVAIFLVDLNFCKKTDNKNVYVSIQDHFYYFNHY